MFLKATIISVTICRISHERTETSGRDFGTFLLYDFYGMFFMTCVYTSHDDFSTKFWTEFVCTKSV